jgi:hypothetical protein
MNCSDKLNKINNMNIKSYARLGASLLTIFTLFSCNDSKIAKEMEGTWTRSYVTSYEDGTKSHVDEQIAFKYDASDKENDGGSFVEICTGQEEEEEDNIRYKYRWVSRIEGTWKIELGSLYQHYNLSTLEVEIGKDDLKMDDGWFGFNLSQLFPQELLMLTDVFKELKKETYKQLFRSYKLHNNQDNQELGFNDVQVKDNILSYETGDMGKVTFHRVKDQKTKQQNNNVGEKNKKQEIKKENVSPVRLADANVEYWDNVETQGDNTYVPANMLDGNISTAWAVNLDKASFDSDKLYGPVFTLSCKKLSHIIIHNGYAKSEELYKNNSRASRIIFCNADNVSDEDEQASYLFEGILKDTPDKQILEIDPELSCNNNIKTIQIIIPVDGIRYGAKWRDLCISEIEFWGYK